MRARAGLEGSRVRLLPSEGCQCTVRETLAAGNMNRLGYLASVARKTEGEAGIKGGLEPLLVTPPSDARKVLPRFKERRCPCSWMPASLTALALPPEKVTLGSKGG